MDHNPWGKTGAGPKCNHTSVSLNAKHHWILASRYTKWKKKKKKKKKKEPGLLGDPPSHFFGFSCYYGVSHVHGKNLYAFFLIFCFTSNLILRPCWRP